MSTKKHGSHSKCGSSCNKPCCKPKPCDGKCHLKLVNHCDQKCDIRAEKNLLNLTYITEGSGISEPDVSATFEIVIFNRCNSKLTHLSIVDSLMGLQPNVFGPTGTFGGELRPYFTNVSVTTCHGTIIPNNFSQIVSGMGELVDPASYVPANSVCSVIVRITGRGFRLPVDPTTLEQIPFEGQLAVTMCVQNTAIIKGKVNKKNDCGCHICVPIFPIYVKSGEKQAINVNYEAPQINSP